METKTTQTFDLSDGDVKDAIRDFIEKKFGKGKPITVTVSAEPRSVGYGLAESTTYVPVVSAMRET